MLNYSRILHGILLATFAIFASRIEAQDPLPPPFQLEYVSSINDPDLDAITSVAVSPDGRFVYASAYKSGSHAVFSRDKDSGNLKVVQTIKKNHLGGSTALRLNSDGNLAAAASFRSRAVSLYSRNEETGMLEILDFVEPGFPANVQLQFPVDLSFSPDSKYLDVLDGSRVSVFEIVKNGDSFTIEYIDSATDEALSNCRGIAHDPSGKYVFVASSRENTLVALERDDSGKLSLLATIQDETDGATGLESVFGVARSADGKQVYTVSGQQGQGDDSVSVFGFDDAKFTAKQCIVPRDHELAKVSFFNANRNAENVTDVFRGGNEIAVSADGKLVVACATISGSLAVFTRDAQSGELDMIQLVRNKEQLGGVSGIAISPDNRHVYSANEFRDSVSVFQVTRAE